MSDNYLEKGVSFVTTGVAGFTGLNLVLQNTDLYSTLSLSGDVGAVVGMAVGGVALVSGYLAAQDLF